MWSYYTHRLIDNSFPSDVISGQQLYASRKPSCNCCVYTFSLTVTYPAYTAYIEFDLPLSSHHRYIFLTNGRNVILYEAHQI